MLTYENVEIFNHKTINVDQYVNPKLKKFLFIDRNIYELYKDNIIGSNIDYYIFESSEENKSLTTCTNVYHNLLINNYGRNDYLICIGGGITTDVGGYIAATYNRGINLISIPTTLLSQVDSSVGSKNGVNFEGFKNVIGTFYEPEKVLINTYFLTTLPEKDYYESFSEIIKYSVITNFKMTKNLIDKKFDLQQLIYECIKTKSKIVAEDKFDKGVRHILNYGHSLAHLIENKYGYSHAFSVAQGMYMTSVIFNNTKITKYLLELFNTYEIKVKDELTLDLNFLITDKKSNNEVIKEIVVNKLGSYEIIDVPITHYIERYNEYWLHKN